MFRSWSRFYFVLMAQTLPDAPEGQDNFVATLSWWEAPPPPTKLLKPSGSFAVNGAFLAVVPHEKEK
jgi:hypothetical protein